MSSVDEIFDSKMEEINKTIVMLDEIIERFELNLFLSEDNKIVLDDQVKEQK